MVDRCAELLATKLSSIAWVDRIAGLAVPAQRVVPGPEGERIVVQYPAAYTPDARKAFHDQMLEELAPDKRLRSLMYFEDLTGLRVSRKSLKAYEGTMRIVVWLNMPALGYTQQVAHLATMELLRTISSAVMHDETLSVQVLSQTIPQKDPTLLPQYLSAERLSLLVWPFDYFAVDFTYRVTPLGCPSLALREPIDCPPL